jgi:hypothetical protein
VDVSTTPLLTAREAARSEGVPQSALDNRTAVSVENPRLIHAFEPERLGWPRLLFPRSARPTFFGRFAVGRADG